MTRFGVLSISVFLLLLLADFQVQGGPVDHTKGHVGSQLAKGAPEVQLKQGPSAPPARQTAMRPSKLLQTDRRITATSSKATATISQARLDALDQDELGVDLSELMATLKATVRGITNFGSDVSDIKDGAQRVLRLIPRIDQARKSLLASAPSQKSADLQQINRLALRAGSRLSRSMKAILKNPADANIIRKEYRHIRESLKIITSDYEQTVTAVFPGLVSLTLEQRRLVEQVTGTKNSSSKGLVKTSDKATSPLRQAGKGERRKVDSGGANGTTPPASRRTTGQEVPARSPTQQPSFSQHKGPQSLPPLSRPVNELPPNTPPPSLLAKPHELQPQHLKDRLTNSVVHHLVSKE